MLRIFKYLKPHRWAILLLLFFTFAQSLANLTLPDLMAKIVNQGIIAQESGVIYRYGLFMILITLIGGAFVVGIAYLASRIGTSFATTVREKLFVKIENSSLSQFNTFSTASLITRNTNDVQQIQVMTIMFLRMALMAPFIAVIAVFKAFTIAPSMTWIMALAVLLLITIVSVVFKIALPRFSKLQELLDRLNLVTREMLTGLRVIRAFRKEKSEEERFEKVNYDLASENLFLNRLMAVLHPGIMFLLNFSMLAIVWFGARQIDLGRLPIGDMMAFMQYAMQAIFAFHMISMIFIMIPRASVSINRVLEVLESEEAIKDPQRPAIVPAFKGKVEFKNVSFSYFDSEDDVLKNISFVADPGKTTAIIGSTGSGKTSLVQLIPRFFDVNQGEVSIDGHDVRSLSQENFRSRISYVSQKAILFSGSIQDNISYGRPGITKEEMSRAARVSQSEFIDNLPEKFASPVSQAGVNLSGGQKQRLAIARALAKPADVYIFDDSFSALDFKTDVALRQSLKAEIKDKTIIIVAQRINTIINADKIIVLDSGEIVGEGRHGDLLKNSKIYREIALSQLSEEELAEEKH